MNEEHVLVSLRQHLAAVSRRRRVVFSTLTVALVVAVLYNTLTRPLYEATAQILIERQVTDVTSSQEILTERTQGADYLQTQYHLLGGRALAERVVARLSLDKTAEFSRGPTHSPWERLRQRLFGTPRVEPEAGKTGPGAEARLSPAVSAFRSRVSVEPVPGSNLVNLRFRAYDPILASQAVNTLAQEYIAQSLEFRYTASSETTGWLSEQMEDQRRKVEAAEKALQEYRQRENLLNLEERKALVGQKLTTLMGAVMAARTERITNQTLYEQMRSMPPERLAAFPQMLGNMAIQSMRARHAELQREQARLGETLGDKHPEMVRVDTELRALEAKMAAEMQTVVRSVESAYRTASQQEASLQANLETVRQEAFGLEHKSVEDNVLKRQLESNQQLYTNLVNRSKSGSLEQELKSTNIRIVEKAEIPVVPMTPRKMRNYQLALGIGLLGGILLIVIAEQLDSTIKTPDDLKQNLDLPFLGVVAEVSSRRTAPGPGALNSPIILKAPRSTMAEAYRVIRTNLMYSSASTTGRLIAVSSVNPGEGKSTTVVNIATSLAQTGARVLMVDADLRRPTLHSHLNVISTPGLTDAIVNHTPAEEVIKKTSVAGLDILVCGYMSPNPSELLGSPALQELLLTLQQSYDWVVVDTPPILGMADTPVIARLVEGLVLVVCADSTSKHALKRAVEMVTGVGAKVMGVVLNRVDMERHSYYYGEHYGEYYRSYYASADVPSTTPRDQAKPRKQPPVRRA